VGLPDDIIGLGLYTPAEAAAYARVGSAKFSRWVFGTRTADPVFDPQLGRNGERIATFLDLAQALTVHDVRHNVEVPLQKIRAAYLRAKEVHKVQFPFAMKHGAFLFGDLETKEGRRRCEVGIFVKNAAHGPRSLKEAQEVCIQLTGKKKDNLLFEPIVMPFSKKLVFSEESGLASEYEVYKAHGYRIVIDPEIRFGQPYVEKLGYEARSLYNAVNVERTIERVAKLYHVPVGAVRAADEYIRSIENTTPTKHAA